MADGVQTPSLQSEPDWHEPPVGAAEQRLFVQTPETQSLPELQFEPDVTTAQRFTQSGPPQSTPVSVPSCVPLKQSVSGAEHTPPAQLPEPQSLETPQATPIAHLPTAPLTQMPPQSTPVSVPDSTLSLQVRQRLPSQRLEEQSVPAEHASPVPHAPHVPPPQSTSVSAPFFKPSLHEGAAQLPALQTPLSQKELPVHAAPVARPVQSSEEQVPDAQSVPAAQASLFAQSAAHEPPQSTPVSEPPPTASKQATGVQTLAASVLVSKRTELLVTAVVMPVPRVPSASVTALLEPRSTW